MLPNLLCLQLNSPSSLSFFSYERCSSPLTTLVALRQRNEAWNYY